MGGEGIALFVEMSEDKTSWGKMSRLRKINVWKVKNHWRIGTIIAKVNFTSIRENYRRLCSYKTQTCYGYKENFYRIHVSTHTVYVHVYIYTSELLNKYVCKLWTDILTSALAFVNIFFTLFILIYSETGKKKHRYLYTEFEFLIKL
jgi:hypothetical protein